MTSPALSTVSESVAIVEVLEADLLQVQDDLGDILNDSGKGSELVLCAGDTNGSDRSAFKRRKKDAAETVADRVSETSLERLCRESGVGFGSGGFVFDKTIRDFKRS